MYLDDGIDYLTKQANEILTEIIVPGTSDSIHCRSSFWKLRRRGSIDFATLSVAAAVWTDDKGQVTRASMYLGGRRTHTCAAKTAGRTGRSVRTCRA